MAKTFTTAPADIASVKHGQFGHNWTIPEDAGTDAEISQYIQGWNLDSTETTSEVFVTGCHGQSTSYTLHQRWEGTINILGGGLTALMKLKNLDIPTTDGYGIELVGNSLSNTILSRYTRHIETNEVVMSEIAWHVQVGSFTIPGDLEEGMITASLKTDECPVAFPKDGTTGKFVALEVFRDVGDNTTQDFICENTPIEIVTAWGTYLKYAFFLSLDGVDQLDETTFTITPGTKTLHFNTAPATGVAIVWALAYLETQPS